MSKQYRAFDIKMYHRAMNLTTGIEVLCIPSAGVVSVCINRETNEWQNMDRKQFEVSYRLL